MCLTQCNSDFKDAIVEREKENPCTATEGENIKKDGRVHRRLNRQRS